MKVVDLALEQFDEETRRIFQLGLEPLFVKLSLSEGTKDSLYLALGEAIHAAAQALVEAKVGEARIAEVTQALGGNHGTYIHVEPLQHRLAQLTKDNQAHEEGSK